MAFKFLHCGDLHLGCMPNRLEERFEDFFISFKELIDRCINEECEYILISGDIFHLKTINSKTLLRVTELMEYAKNNGIKIFAIEGNHDKAFYVDEDSWLKYLDKRGFLTLLTHKIVDGELIIDDDSIYEDENIRIIGIGYLGVQTSDYLKTLSEKIEKKDKFTVLMIHAAINRLCGQDMGDVDIKDLEPLKEKIDYIALGHIHVRYEEGDFCFNPGSLENIRITDALRKDRKGYYIVSVDNKEKSVKYYNSIQRDIEFRNISLEKDKTIDEITNTIINYDYNIEKDSVLDITLYGQISFNPYLLNFEEIKEKIKEKYGLLYIEINNYINIINKASEVDNITDIKKIEKEAILNYLDINYPDLIDKETEVKDILELKKALTDGIDLDIIIKNMIEEKN